MKKWFFAVTLAVVALLGVFAFGCKKSDASVVGTYYLVTVTADNGTAPKVYSADGTNPSVTKNSFVLNIKDNYKWDMNIMLPGITETEDGKWEDKNGSYNLIEDKDEPVIPLTYNDGILEFTIAENGYILSVKLSKNL